MRSRSKKVRPALYRFEGLGEFVGADWHWAELRDVAEIIGTTPREVYDRFKPLVEPLDNRYPGTNLHWVQSLSVGAVPCCGHHEVAHREPAVVCTAFRGYDLMLVSAGFAIDVIKAAELGVVRVERKEDIGRQPYPPGTLRVYYLMLSSDDRRARPTAPDPSTICIAAIGYYANGQPVVVPGKEGRELLK